MSGLPTRDFFQAFKVASGSLGVSAYRWGPSVAFVEHCGTICGTLWNNLWNTVEQPVEHCGTMLTKANIVVNILCYNLQK